MSTLDKINNELSVLQSELDQLQHYTVEIGNAKEASMKVIAMSQEFINTFQKSVNMINDEMTAAGEDFKNQCAEVSTDLDKATTDFQNGIAQAKSTLNEISQQLSKAAGNVNDLTKKIEDINILGHFQRIHNALEEASARHTENHAQITSRIESMETKMLSETKRLNTWLIVSIVLGALALIGIGILLFI